MTARTKTRIFAFIKLILLINLLMLLFLTIPKRPIELSGNVVQQQNNIGRHEMTVFDISIATKQKKASVILYSNKNANAESTVK